MIALNDIFPALFNYFVAALLIMFVFAASHKSDRLYMLITGFIMKKAGRVVPAGNWAGFRTGFKEPVSVPGRALVSIAVFAPALAVASLVTLCAGLPFCTFIPITDSGADIIQMAQLFLLSEAFVVASLCSLGTKEGFGHAAAEVNDVLRLLFAFTAATASLASFFVKNGGDRDPFSISSFSVVGRFSTMSLFGICGSLLFAFVVLSQIPGRGAAFSLSLLKEEDMPEFRGAPRALLSMWSAARSFIIISIVVFVFFPYNLIDNIGEGAGIAWYGQAINFAAFWLAVLLFRLAVVPFCQLTMSFIERRLPAKLACAAMPFFVAAAMALLWYEEALLLQEAAVF